MVWLTAADEGLKALALRMADHIEEAQALSDEVAEAWAEAGADQSIHRRLVKLEAAVDVAQMVARLGPQIAMVLKELGSGPRSRKSLNLEKRTGGRLAALRDASGKHNS